MPDGVAEYRCPQCSYQIPMVMATQLGSLACDACGTDPAAVGVVAGCGFQRAAESGELRGVWPGAGEVLGVVVAEASGSLWRALTERDL